MEAEIEVDCDFVERIFRCLIDKPDERRVKAKVYLSNRKLLLKIKTDDLTSLRAALNTYLRQVKVCLDIEEVV